MGEGGALHGVRPPLLHPPYLAPAVPGPAAFPRRPLGGGERRPPAPWLTWRLGVRAAVARGRL